jgi:LuxR family maltose regulon positive regulatory protein
VVSLNAQRSWFRYHALFADLLQLELRRTAPARVAALHETAASWFARHKFPTEAIRHAPAAEHWTMAGRILSDHCLTLRTGGQWATAQALLARFPEEVVVADAELPLFIAVDEILAGSLVHAERLLACAADRSTSLPVDRRRRLQARVAVLRLWVALRRCNPPAVVAEAGRLLGPIDAPDSTQPGLEDELRALAHRNGQRYVEVSALAYSAVPLMYRSFMLARETCARAIDEAREHGWDEAPIAGIAHTVRAVLFVWQGHLDEAQRTLEVARRTVRAEAVPAVGLWLRLARGQLELARGRDQEALTALTAAVHFDDLLETRHPIAGQTRGLMLRLGDAEGVEQALAELDGALRESPELRKATAALRLAQDDAEAATEALAPVIDGSAPVVYGAWLVEAFILEALARETPAQPAARWNVRSISPSPTARSGRSCCTPRPSCSSATRATTPPTALWCARSAACWPDGRVSCAICRPTSRGPRSPTSSTWPRALPRRTSSTSTASSESTAAPTPSSAHAPSGCSHPRRSNDDETARARAPGAQARLGEWTTRRSPTT